MLRTHFLKSLCALLLCAQLLPAHALSRTTQYAESTGSTGSITAAITVTPTDKVTLTFTPDASTTYYLIGNATGFNNTISSDFQFRIQNTTDSVTLAECNWEPKDATDLRSLFGVATYTSGSSPSSTTFKIQAGVEGGTGSISEAHLLAIKADSADQTASSDGETTTTSVSYADKTTLTFTPATTGDYLVIAFAEVAQNSTSASAGAQLDIDGTTYGNTPNGLNDTTNYVPWAAIHKVNLNATSHTLKIQYNTTNASFGTKMRKARIIAIRLDTLDNNYFADARARTTTASTTYQDKVTLTQTPNSVEHVILATATSDHSAANSSTYTNLINGSTINESFVEPILTGSNGNHSHLFLSRFTGSGSSTTWKIQYKAEAGTSGIKEGAIAVLQTADNPAPSSGSGLLMMMGVGQ